MKFGSILIFENHTGRHHWSPTGHRLCSPPVFNTTGPRMRSPPVVNSTGHHCWSPLLVSWLAGWRRVPSSSCCSGCGWLAGWLAGGGVGRALIIFVVVQAFVWVSVQTPVGFHENQDPATSDESFFSKFSPALETCSSRIRKTTSHTPYFLPP